MKMSILLPVKNNQLDLEYMESFIKTLLFDNNRKFKNIEAAI